MDVFKPEEAVVKELRKILVLPKIGLGAKNKPRQIINEHNLPFAEYEKFYRGKVAVAGKCDCAICARRETT